MTDRQPAETTNLDIYGSPPVPWSRPHDLLVASPQGENITFFLGTTRPDGRPHSAGIGALWHDGDFFLVSGPASQKSKNLAANMACTLSVKLEGIDLILEGDASRVTDKAALEKAAELYRGVGWPAQVEGNALTAPFSAPSAGPPPWYLYRFTFNTAFGVTTAEPHGATRWRFDH